MADIAFKPGVAARKAAAKKTVAKKVVAGRKHRGDNQGAVRVMGQTAAVAGLSGVLLLALKAMVLVAPSVLPHGNGLDSLGRPIPSAGISSENTAPVSIGSALNSAPAASSGGPVARQSSGGTSELGSGSGSGANSGSGGNAGGNTSTTPGGSGGGGTTAPVIGPVSSLLGTTVNTLSSVPVLGPTVSGLAGTATQVLTPVTSTADEVVGTVASVAAPVLTPVKQVVQSTNLGSTVKSLPVVGTVVGGAADSLGITTSNSGSSTSPGSGSSASGGLLGSVTNVLGIG